MGMIAPCSCWNLFFIYLKTREKWNIVARINVNKGNLDGIYGSCDFHAGLSN